MGLIPSVSVVMSVYNGERFLLEATESILSQTFENFEFVIVNDGSTDSSQEILRSYLDVDTRIRLLVNDKQMGLSASLNRGIAAARGTWIARQDADDLSEPTRLENQLDYLRSHPETKLLGTGYQHIDGNGRVLKTCELPLEWNRLRWALMFFCPFIHTSVVFDRSLAQRVGLYSTDLYYASDYDLWKRMLFVAEGANLREPLVSYRTSPWSMTSTMKPRLEEGPRISISMMSSVLEKEEVSRNFWNSLRTLVCGPGDDLTEIDVKETHRQLLRLHRRFCKLFQVDKRARRCHLAELNGQVALRVILTGRKKKSPKLIGEGLKIFLTSAGAASSWRSFFTPLPRARFGKYSS